MELIRTFHPVGHGGFSTEEFIDDTNHCKYRVVYDCGSKKEDFVNNSIKKHFQPHSNKSIDLLFISHLHSDHINGIYELWRNNIEIKRYILPLLSEIEIIYKLIKYKSQNSGHINSKNKDDEFLNEIYKIFKNTEDTEKNITLIDINPIDDNSKIDYLKYTDTIELNNHQNTPLIVSLDDYWIYIPYYYKNNLYPDFSYENIHIEISYFLSNKIIFDYIYSKASKKNIRNKHDDYLMLCSVFNGDNIDFQTLIHSDNYVLVRRFIEESIHILGGKKNCFSHANCLTLYSTSLKNTNNSILYTGDLDRTNKLHDIVVNYYYKLLNDLKLNISNSKYLQYPHHGNYKYYFSKEIIENFNTIIFFANKEKHNLSDSWFNDNPGLRTIQYILDIGKTYIWISEKDNYSENIPL